VNFFVRFLVGFFVGFLYTFSTMKFSASFRSGSSTFLFFSFSSGLSSTCNSSTRFTCFSQTSSWTFIEFSYTFGWGFVFLAFLGTFCLASTSFQCSFSEFLFFFSELFSNFGSACFVYWSFSTFSNCFSFGEWSQFLFRNFFFDQNNFFGMYFLVRFLVGFLVNFFQVKFSASSSFGSSAFLFFSLSGSLCNTCNSSTRFTCFSQTSSCASVEFLCASFVVDVSSTSLWKSVLTSTRLQCRFSEFEFSWSYSTSNFGSAWFVNWSSSTFSFCFTNAIGFQASFEVDFGYNNGINFIGNYNSFWFFDFVYSSASLWNRFSALSFVGMINAFKFSTNSTCSSQTSSGTSIWFSDAFLGVWCILACLGKFCFACTSFQYSSSEFNFSFSDFFSYFNSAFFINISSSTFFDCLSFGERSQWFFWWLFINKFYFNGTSNFFLKFSKTTINGIISTISCFRRSICSTFFNCFFGTITCR